MYEDIALYYDLIHADLIADIAYVLDNFSPDEGAVLILGCGTGRAIWPLAQAGFTVVGLDNSPAMLARARKGLSKEVMTVRRRITLVNGDMRDFNCDREFGIAIALNNTFMHLRTVELEQTLMQVRECLGENGRLYIDLINPIILASTPDNPHPAPEQELVVPENEDVVVQSSSNWLDNDAQTLHVQWIYERERGGRGTGGGCVVDEQYCYHFPHQWEIILRKAGFQLRKMAGDYDNSLFAEDSPRLLMQAE